jgi:nucleoside-diphosphate-sugar epimerase
MVIAVTGSNGFVGRNLISFLKKSNDEIIELDLLKGIDITNQNDCSNIPAFDVVVHLAAKIFVPDSYKLPHDFYFTNYIGTLNMLELCRKFNARMIFASSYVYGNPQYLPIDENHPLVAFNPYADSKIQGENLCRSYHNFFGIKTIIVRPFNLFGRGQHNIFLISSILEQAKTGTINLQSSKPRRDYIYIDDMVAAYIKMIYNTQINFEIFNIGSGKSYSVKEIAEMINNEYGNKLHIKFSNLERLNEVENTVSDIQRAKSILKWEPQITMLEGIKKYLHESN